MRGGVRVGEGARRELARLHLAGQQQAAAVPSALPDRLRTAAFTRKGAEQDYLARTAVPSSGAV